MSSKTATKTTTATVSKTTKAAPAKKEEVTPVAAAAAPSGRASKASAASTTPVATPVAAPATATAPAEDEVSLVAEFNTQVAKVNELRNQLGVVLGDLKKMEKRLSRELKRAGRRRRTRAPAVDEAGNPVPKKPSVFTKPQQITDNLCVFLGKPKGTQVSRSDVTRGIMDYVKKHSLNNKQDINPDAALRKLLDVKEGEKVTILNLQRFLKNHYVKTA